MWSSQLPFSLKGDSGNDQGNCSTRARDAWTPLSNLCIPGWCTSCNINPCSPRCKIRTEFSGSNSPPYNYLGNEEKKQCAFWRYSYPLIMGAGKMCVTDYALCSRSEEKKIEEIWTKTWVKRNYLIIRTAIAKWHLT